MDRHTTTSLSPGRPSFWGIIVLIIVVGVLLVLTTDVLGSETPAIGDWEIDDVVIITGHDAIVTGNITVRDGGSLQLYSLSLAMNQTTHGQYNIEVEDGGRLVMDGVTVDSLDGASRFNITLRGIANINGSIIRRMDGPPAPSPLSNPQGLVVLSSSVTISNSEITDCGGFAVTVEPGGLNDVSPIIRDCYFTGNGGGIYCGGMLVSKGNARIDGCGFTGNGLGDILVVASDPTITDCYFDNDFINMGITGVTAVGLAAPTIQGCQFTFHFAAVNSVFADPTVRDCTIAASVAGVTVVGGDPTFEEVTITTCILPVNLTSTSATFSGCTISGFNLNTYAIEIDGGRPIIQNSYLDQPLFGGVIHIANDSRAIVKESWISGSGYMPCISVEDSIPTLESCTIEGGYDGIELISSPAIIERCALMSNEGWGIISWYEQFVNRENSFGTGISENGIGRIVQYYNLELWVELEDGRPAVDASVFLIDSFEDLMDETVSDGTGLAFDEPFVAYEVTNSNRTNRYSPYVVEAWLGDLYNITSVDLSTNRNITLVLRPVIDLPPVVEILTPRDGGEYDVWEHGNHIPFEGFVADPEEGEVIWAWYLQGEMVNDVDLGFDLVLDPNVRYEVALMAVDESGQETWVYHNFTVTSGPPEDNYVEIISPGEHEVFEMGDAVFLLCEYYVLDHPERERPAHLPVRWMSDRDGLLIEEEEGELTNLTPGVHEITVLVEPRFPEFIPEPYTAIVVIEVLAPEPVAVAVISLPEDGWEFRWDVTVHLAANGSYIDIWDPPEYRVIYRWSSDIDGLLGEGKELDAPHLVTGAHTITLLLTTVPFLVSDEAAITIIVHPDPNHPPVARISVLTIDHTAGKPVLMTASLSADPDGDILTYLWDLGDGNSSTSLEVNHTYAEAGNYTLRLTVFDGELEGVDALTIEVVPGSNGGNGGNGGGNGGGGGNGDGDDGTVEPSDTWLGWLVIVLLFASLGALLVLWFRGRPRREE